MVSAVATDKLFSNCKILTYDPGNCSTAKDVAWVDLKDYRGFAVIATAIELAGTGITAFKILANAASDGSGTDVEIKAHAVGTAPDAAGDTLVLECTSEEIAHLAETNGLALRYVSANITCNNASDDIAVTYIRHGARFPQDGLTADVIA